MPFANGVDITALIQRIPVPVPGAKRVTENQMVKMLTKLIKDMTRFEAKVEAGEKATLNLKINGEALRLSFDPNKDSLVEGVEFTVGGMTFSPSDIDPQQLAETALASLRSAAPEGQARDLVEAVAGMVESVSGNLAGIDVATVLQGLTGSLGLDSLPTAVTDALAGLGNDPAGVLTSAIDNLGGGSLNGNPTRGNPAGPVLNPAAGPALDTAGETGGNNTAPALDAFNVVNGGPVDFLFNVASNTSTFNTGSDQTAPVRETAQGDVPPVPGGVPSLPGAPSLPAAPDLGAITGIVGSLPVAGLFGLLG